MNRQADQEQFQRIQKGDRKAFEAVFRAYYPFLCLYATQLLKDSSAAEEIVQELFVNLWEKKENIHVDTSLKNYLYRSVKNRCLNYVRHSKIKEEYFRIAQAEQINPEEDFESQAELMQKIESSIASLPEKRREMFILSREEGLKYREIATRLNVSIKTVETQMGLAIKSLREMLRDFLPLF
ncbi:MAG: RNA polymerase sigma-70 factor [Bacteroidota bacterium]